MNAFVCLFYFQMKIQLFLSCKKWNGCEKNRKKMHETQTADWSNFPHIFIYMLVENEENLVYISPSVSTFPRYTQWNYDDVFYFFSLPLFKFSRNTLCVRNLADFIRHHLCGTSKARNFNQICSQIYRLQKKYKIHKIKMTMKFEEKLKSEAQLRLIRETKNEMYAL